MQIPVSELVKHRLASQKKTEKGGNKTKPNEPPKSGRPLITCKKIKFDLQFNYKIK